jgi:hypothetical protein
MFEIGQQVVCINDKKTPAKIKEGQTYTVHGLLNCCVYYVDIGQTMDKRFEGSKCNSCGNIVMSRIEYVDARRFVPLEDYEAMEKLFETLKEPVLC